MANRRRNIYPERLDYIDQVFAFANEKVAQYANSADLHSQATQSNILNLLLAPVKAYFSLFTALALPNFIPLLDSQPYPTRRAVAGEVARSLLRNQTKITTQEDLDGVLEILKVLIKEGAQQSAGYPGGPLQRKGVETDETIEEQGWLARIIHLIQSPSNDTQLKVPMPFSRIPPIHTHTHHHFPTTAPPNRPPSLHPRRRPHQIHNPSPHHRHPHPRAPLQSA